MWQKHFIISNRTNISCNAIIFFVNFHIYFFFLLTYLVLPIFTKLNSFQLLFTSFMRLNNHFIKLKKKKIQKKNIYYHKISSLKGIPRNTVYLNFTLGHKYFARTYVYVIQTVFLIFAPESVSKVLPCNLNHSVYL